MKSLLSLTSLWTVLFTGSLTAETRREHCATHHLLAAPQDSSAFRKFAPDRKADFLHLKLDITPDFQKRTLKGKATLQFQPIARPLEDVRLDAVDLNIASVTSPGRPLTYTVQEEALLIHFAKPVELSEKAEIVIEYSGQPTRGLYFRTPEMGYRKTDTHLFTQGEADESRHWFPSYDYPNEKFTSEILARVPEDMIVLSNGKMVSDSVDQSSGLRVTHWHQDKPHVNYLVTLVAGKFAKLEDKHGDLPLAFYVPVSEKDQAASSFQDTKDVMSFFEKEIGVAYPWAKYFQVCVNDFHFGGMENTSLTVLTDRTLFVPEWENLKSSQGLVAHELAHQWFGDLVTCKDWSHIWLNEGFATYYTHLYDGHKNGRDSMLYELWMDARGFLDVPNDIQPIVYRNYDNPNQQFGFHAYPKGSWVLHMLRSQLGEELFRKIVKTYLERHQYGTVVTEDLNRIIEEFSGRSFDRFFDQWVYHAHHPELNITFGWDAKNKAARISVQQNQKLSEHVLLFQFPLPVRFKTADGTVINRVLQVKEKAEDFYITLPAEPKTVRIDPDLTVLAKIQFQPPGAMLRQQIADESDVMGRLLAAQAYGSQRTLESVQLLEERLKKDPFYGVRLEASKSLRTLQTPEALKALIAQRDAQTDARVRNQVTQDIAGSYREESRVALAAIAQKEKNPEIRADALLALSLYPQTDAPGLIQEALGKPSYRHVVGDAAIGAMRRWKSPAMVAPLLEYLKANEEQLSSGQMGRALDTLAYLSRDETNQAPILQFLLSKATSPRLGVQLGAIGALGTLENPQGLSVLETFVVGSKPTPQKNAAENAIKAIQNAKKPFDQLQQLRTEVLDLQKTNRELRQEMEALKKKFESLPAAPAPATTNKVVEKRKVKR